VADEDRLILRGIGPAAAWLWALAVLGACARSVLEDTLDGILDGVVDLLSGLFEVARGSFRIAFGGEAFVSGGAADTLI
jgi:hypothetical protein